MTQKRPRLAAGPASCLPEVRLRRASGFGCVGLRSDHLFLVSFRQIAELLHGADVELADAFLGDAQLLADLLEGHAFVPRVEPGPHANDLAFARVEILEQTIDLVARLLGALQKI